MNLDMKTLKARIEKRRKKLKKASKELKRHFVGLDHIIDRVISNIETWYVLPEILTRPTIINLWGMTGVGKTDLVRRLVKALDFQDRFLETQLSTKGISTHGADSLEKLFSFSNVEPGIPGIILLDEIQRFRSVDEEGGDIHDYQFQDVWTLLSDGSFGSVHDRKKKLQEMLFSTMYWNNIEEVDEDDEEETEDSPPKTKTVKSKSKKKILKYRMSYWEAQSLKSLLQLSESIGEVMLWTHEKQIEVITDKIEDPSLYEGRDFSKLCIFVSGNLDEAYHMAGQTANLDVDADIFHEHSNKINFLTVKTALLERFKPEQIARLGNTHLIYPSLSKRSYKTIINRKLKELTNRVRKNTGFRVKVGTSLREAVYRNGVFPTQGTRPLFSTISSMVEAVLPYFMLKALDYNSEVITLSFKQDQIMGEFDQSKETATLNCVAEVDELKSSADISNIHQVTIHEVGHAVVYAALLKTAPSQISVNTLNEENMGFVAHNQIVPTGDNLLKQICFTLAGRAAEETYLLEGSVGAGAGGDIGKATTMAGAMIRDYGMGDYLTWMRRSTHRDFESELADTRVDDTNEALEEIMRIQKARAHTIIGENEDLLLEVVDILEKVHTLDAKGFQRICKRHGLKVDVVPMDQVIGVKQVSE